MRRDEEEKRAFDHCVVRTRTRDSTVAQKIAQFFLRGTHSPGQPGGSWGAKGPSLWTENVAQFEAIYCSSLLIEAKVRCYYRERPACLPAWPPLPFPHSGPAAFPIPCLTHYCLVSSQLCRLCSSLRSAITRTVAAESRREREKESGTARNRRKRKTQNATHKRRKRNTQSTRKKNTHTQNTQTHKRKTHTNTQRRDGDGDGERRWRRLRCVGARARNRS